MPKRKETENAKILSEATIRIVAIIALSFVLWLDATKPDFDPHDIELGLVGVIAAAQAKETIKKVKGKQ